jgi:hypothetical protein
MEVFYYKKKSPGPIKRYQMLREENSGLRGIETQNISQAKIELELIRDKDGIQHFRFDMLEYTQSNQTGLYKWVNDLSSLRKNLVIETRGDGMIGCILNIDQVKKEWNRLRPILEREHRSEESMLKMLNMMGTVMDDGYKLADVLRYTPPFVNIFPPLLDKELKETADSESPGYREIENFVGVKSIPLLTNEYVLKEKQEDCKIVEVTGEIDRVVFEQHLVTDFVKTIRGRSDVKTQVDLKYNEKYAIDWLGWPKQCLQMYLIRIPGFLYREEKVMIKNLSSWEKNMYRTAYS